MISKKTKVVHVHLFILLKIIPQHLLHVLSVSLTIAIQILDIQLY